MKLIVGIGNPGKEYIGTRHNIGFEVIDNYIGQEKWSKKHNSNVLIINDNGNKNIFIKPLTYVNLSGNEVLYFANYYNILAKDILIIHDDINLEFGKIRVKQMSSSGGHNGIKSVIQELSTNEFVQLKIGVSIDSNIDIKDYVLGKFSNDEKKVIDELLPVTKCIISDFINNEDIEKIMNKYN